LDEIISRALFDRTLTIIRDMNPEIFDRHWTLPRLVQILAKVKDIDSETHPKEYIKSFSDKLVIYKQPRVIHFATRGKIGRNWSLLGFVYDFGEWLREGELYKAKLDLITAHLGPPPLDAKRMIYALDDLKPELISGLLKIEGRLNNKKRLVDLYESLRERYARKDEQMDRLIAKARR
jgi:hypothetical protein